MRAFCREAHLERLLEIERSLSNRRYEELEQRLLGSLCYANRMLEDLGQWQLRATMRAEQSLRSQCHQLEKELDEFRGERKQ
jgi:hypothetical protein